MPAEAILIIPAEWLALKALDAGLSPIAKRRAKKVLENQISQALNRAILATVKNFGQINPMTAVQEIGPLLKPYLEKLINPVSTIESDTIGETFAHFSMGEVDPKAIGEFFQDRIFYELYQISDLQQLLNHRLALSTSKRLSDTHTIVSQFDEKLNAVLQPLNAKEESEFVLNVANASPGLLDWPTRLHDGQSIKRPEFKTITDRIKQQGTSSTLLLGLPGSGKSSLLAMIGQEYEGQDDYTVIPVKADQLPQSINCDERLGEHIGLGESALANIIRLSLSSTVIVLIDQLDSVADLVDLTTQRLNTLIELITDLKDKPNIHVVASCRPFEFSHDPRFIDFEGNQLELSLPDWCEIQPILNDLGLDTSTWSVDQQRQASVPQFLNYLQEVGPFSPNEQILPESFSGLIDLVWRKKIPDASTRSFISRVALDMAEAEDLMRPLTQYEAELSEFESAHLSGVFYTEPKGLRFGFRHQTMFDHAIARGFIAQQVQLRSYVLAHQESLNFRPRFWAILRYLREAAPNSYEKEFIFLWRHNDLRYHMRLLLIDFLGSIASPAQFELRIVQQCLRDEELAVKTALSLRGHNHWFLELTKNDIAYLMNEEPGSQTRAALILLSAALSFARDKVLHLLAEFWHAEPYLEHLQEVLLKLDDWSEEAVQLSHKTIQIDSHDNWALLRLARIMGVTRPNDSARFVVLAIKASYERIKKTWEPKSTLDNSPLHELLGRQSNWFELDAIATASPLVFWQELSPWLAEKMDEAISEDSHRRGYKYFYIYGDFMDEAKDRHEYDILYALFVCMKEIIEQDTANFVAAAKHWRQSEVRALQAMYCRTLGLVAKENPKLGTDYLLEDDRRLELDLSFGRDSLDTRLLIRAISTSGDTTQISRLFDHISKWNSQHKYAQEVDDAGIKLERMRWARRDRFDLLLAFERTFLSTKQLRFLEEEQRAFPNTEAKELSAWMPEVSTIVSPMSSDQMILAKDSDISRLLLEIPDHVDDVDFNRKVGGSDQLTHAFAGFAKNEPQRAMNILLGLPVKNYANPATGSLRSICGAEGVNIKDFWEYVDKQLKRGFDKQEEFIEGIADSIRDFNQQKISIPDKYVDLLIHELASFPLRADKEKEEEDIVGADIESILYGNDWGGGDIVPTGAYRLLSSLWWTLIMKEPHQGDRAVDVFGAFIERNDCLGTWDHLCKYDLRHLHLCDKGKVFDMLDNLWHRYSGLFSKHSGAYLLGRNIFWFSNGQFQTWFERLKSAGNDFTEQLLGELLVLRWIVHPGENWIPELISELINSPLDNRPNLVIGIGFGLSHYWPHKKYRKQLTPVFLELMSTNEEAVHKATVDALSRIEKAHLWEKEVELYLDNLVERALCKNTKSGYHFVSTLIDCVHIYPRHVYDIAMQLLELFQVRGNQTGLDIMDLRELVSVSILLQKEEGFQTAGLNLFEALLRVNADGVENVLQSIDGNSHINNSGQSPRQLRRRRKPRK